MSEIGLHTGQGRRVAAPRRRARGCLDVMLILTEAGLAVVLMTMLLFVGAYLFLSHQLQADINRVVSFQGTGLGGTPRILDRQGNLLFELAPVERRQWLSGDQIPDHVKQATVAVEDDTFWTNPGFDPAAIVAAAVNNFRHQDERPVGASTITQQLVRHVAFDYEERLTASYQRKALEIFYAFILTRQRSKQDILTMYLNEVYYGNLAYGIEAASETYFDKPAAELTIAEGAFLAGLPQAPLDWNPYTNFTGAKARQEFILDLMVEDGALDPELATAEKQRRLTLAPLLGADSAGATYLDTPHFVLYVQEELTRRYGPDAFQQNGWQVTTTLDLNIQRLAETAAHEHVWSRAGAHDVSNAAVVALKPGTGEILAMVGSLDYFDPAIDGQFNMALVPRQPGSSFKPITYVAAMAQGWTTGDVLWDVPIELDLGGGETMAPRNYDDAFHGPVLLRDALANSYNIPPIQLIRDIGVPLVIATARQMGVESLQEPPGYYGLSLTLGGGEVPLLEMTRAYATLANGGRRPDLTSIARIVDSAGRTVYAGTRRAPQAGAVDPRISYIISDILSDNKARTPAMGAYSSLRLPFPAAAKTGTSNDYRDNWTIGFTPGLVVGVWSGNTDGRPMWNSSGLAGAAPIWNRVMQGIYTEPAMKAALLVNDILPPEEFERPAGIEEKTVCLPRGTGGTRCTASRTDLFLAGGPLHAVSRLSYRPDVTSQPGAWTLAVRSLSSGQSQRAWESQPILADETRPPRPALCVQTLPGGGSTRLLLPVPPFYADEVRARLWAQGRGYQMAPATVCPAGAASGGAFPSTEGAAEQGLPPPSGTVYTIAAPAPGEALAGQVAVVGTAAFNPAEVAYFKLEIGAGTQPTAWTTFGTTHANPVQGGVLEILNADALPPGDYVIRLVLVRLDGNFTNPYAVPVTIPPR